MTLPIAGWLMLLGLSACAQPLKEEPAQGMLKPGETVRVDDGTCPPGQIRKVDVGVSSADKNLPAPRTSNCVIR